MRTARSITESEVLENLGWVQKLARRLVGDGADDLVQSVCVAALDGGRIESSPADDDRPRVRAWLARAASYLASNERRSEGRRRARERRRARSEAVPATIDVVARNALVLRVVKAVDRLREPYRTTLLLRYLDEVPVREIARRLEVSEAVVRKRLSRSLTELRQALADRGIDRRALVAIVPLPNLAAKAALVPTLVPAVVPALKSAVGVPIMAAGKICAGFVVAGVATFVLVDSSGSELDATDENAVQAPLADAAASAAKSPSSSASSLDSVVVAKSAEDGRESARAVRETRTTRPPNARERDVELARREAMLQEMAVSLDLLSAEQAALDELEAMPPDGHHVERYPDGKTKAAGQYVNGRRDGVWSTWYENGKLKSRGTYFAGRRHGAWTEWNAAGEETLRGRFHYQRKEGSFEFVKDGKKVQAAYRDDKLHGTCRSLGPDGKRESEEDWFFGRRHGASLRFHPGGRTASRGRYSHGRKVGLWEYWDAEGTLDQEKSGVVVLQSRRTQIEKRKSAMRARLDEMRKLRAQQK